MYLLLVLLSFISLQAAQNSLDLLRKAIRQENKQSIEEILYNYPSLLEDKGFNILHAAVETKSLNLVQYILDRKLVNVNAQDSMGYTALYKAVENNQKEIVELLLNIGADPNLKSDIFEDTPLHAAAWGNFSEIVQLLIDGNADVDAQGLTGLTPLHYAASRGFFEIVKILLEHNANPWIGWCSPDRNVAVFSDTPLYGAISKGYSEIVELFITKYKYFIDVNGLYQVTEDYKTTLLNVAAIKGQVKVMEVLIKLGADLQAVDSKGQSALHQAVYYRKAEVIQFLIEKGIDKDRGDEKGNTPLHVAAEEWGREIVRLLLKAGVDCNKKNKALKKAEEMARDEEIKNILVSTRELFEAIEKGEGTGKIKNLLRARAYIYAKNSQGKTAEILAREAGKTEIENVLRETREFVEALQAEKRILEKYLKGEAVADAFNEEGITPLQWAAQNGCVDVFRDLLNFGAELDDGTVNFFAAGNIAIEKIINQKIKNGKISRNMIGVTAFLSLATIGCAWHEFRQVQKKDQAVPCKKTFFQKLFDGVKRKKKTAVCLALTLLSGGGSWYFAHRKV